MKLDVGDWAAAYKVLIQKAGILAAGARKRGNLERAEHYEAKKSVFSSCR